MYDGVRIAFTDACKSGRELSNAADSNAVEVVTTSNSIRKNTGASGEKSCCTVMDAGLWHATQEILSWIILLSFFP